MSEKQTTFFTINCAEKLESPNQCVRRIYCEIQHKSLEFQHLFHGGDIQTSYPFFCNNIPDVSS
jgi:hypothetical protein